MKVSDMGARFIVNHYQDKLVEFQRNHDPGFTVLSVLRLTAEVEAELNDYLYRGWITKKQRDLIWAHYEDVAQAILDETDEDYGDDENPLT